MVQEGVLHDTLKEYFGFTQFKGNQELIIKSVLGGDDTFVIMPTGGGKSLCYQLPAIISEGTALIISPLIALMKNQVDLVRGYSSNDKIAHFMNSSLSKSQTKIVKEDIRSGETKMLFVAPETLTKEDSLEFFKNTKLSFIAVDEAHCISEWGHDFRPEYRRIRDMLDEIGQPIPIIALTATATPKVRLDILKNLRMSKPQVFISSFLRDNLYYEVKPKTKKELIIKDILKFIKSKEGKSGIIYCLNRKTTEELAQVLNVNGIKAAPYHAGLESNIRSKTQDGFLMEDIDVICATIAFGMGIDKPDVRFVIHYDIPKSLENYYQETGRAGRDGLEGMCLSYFSYDDIHKLEKFLRDKPVAEREIGSQHLMEVTAYSESSSCRRQFLLKHFGEDYDTKNCGNGECDNCKYPKETKEITKETILALETIRELGQNFQIPYYVNLAIGKADDTIKAYNHNQLPIFGVGKEDGASFWNSVIRKALIDNLIAKDIEEYGVISITEKGEAYLKNPSKIIAPINRSFEAAVEANTEPSGGNAVLDPELYKMLKELRKKVAHEKNLPPFVIFQDPSLEEMAAHYPITTEELANISGVGKGKATKYGRCFLELIKEYVEENEIDRPQDFTVKSVVNKSGMKVYIIQNIDKKIPLEDIAKAKGLSRDEFFSELESIVAAGTKVNINYYINDILDEELQDIVYDYFRTAETDSLEAAYEELEEDGVSIEDIQIMRIKFMSEIAN